MLSGLFLAVGVSLVLFPDGVTRFSALMNRTLNTLDDKLLRHRYIVGIGLCGASYLLFRLAFVIVGLRG